MQILEQLFGELLSQDPAEQTDQGAIQESA